MKKKITLTILIILTVISCFDVTNFKDVLINQLGSLFLLGMLGYDIYKGFHSYGAFFCLSVFTVFQIAGAHWLYSFVPYNDWIISLFGWDLNAYFGFERNQYDRFVHLMSGFLFYPYLLEYYTRKSKIRYAASVLMSWFAIQTVGMLYELLEWFVSLILSADSTENYNGQQGDIWDAHKDMALALLSSSLMYFYYNFKGKKTKIKS